MFTELNVMSAIVTAITTYLGPNHPRRLQQASAEQVKMAIRPGALIGLSSVLPLGGFDFVSRLSPVSVIMCIPPT